jgi:hypothetical protein
MIEIDNELNKKINTIKQVINIKQHFEWLHNTQSSERSGDIINPKKSQNTN